VTQWLDPTRVKSHHSTSPLATRHSPLISKEPHWSEQSHLLRTRVPSDRLGWLLDTESLTHRLRQACGGRFRVRVLSQGLDRPLRSVFRVGDKSLLVSEIFLPGLENAFNRQGRQERQEKRLEMRCAVSFGIFP